MLNSERNTATMEKRVARAFRVWAGLGRSGSHVEVRPVFDHGHWWIITEDAEGDEQIFDAVDAEGPGAVDGFDFEGV